MFADPIWWKALVYFATRANDATSPERERHLRQDTDRVSSDNPKASNDTGRFKAGAEF
jgi:hypothetical protein